MDMSFMAKFLVQGATPARCSTSCRADARRRRAGRHHLHPVARRRRRHRGRPHRHQARRRRLLGGRLRHRAPPRRRPGCAGTSATPHAYGHRRDRRLRQLNVQGPRVARAAAVAHRRRPVERGVPVPRRPRDRHRGFARVLVHPDHLPRRARLRAVRPGRAGHARLRPRASRPGAAYGLRHAGLKALASLRMEKGYRDYGHDIDNTDDVLEAGLGFAVALDKPGGFIGREAVLAAKERGTPHHRLVQVLLERPRAAAVPRRGGAARRGGRSATCAPRRTAAPSAARSAWPWSAAASRSRPRGSTTGAWEVDVAGTRYPAEVSLRPMYDPTSARVTG